MKAFTRVQWYARRTSILYYLLPSVTVAFWPQYYPKGRLSSLRFFISITFLKYSAGVEITYYPKSND